MMHYDIITSGNKILNIFKSLLFLLFYWSKNRGLFQKSSLVVGVYCRSLKHQGPKEKEVKRVWKLVVALIWLQAYLKKALNQKRQYHENAGQLKNAGQLESNGSNLYIPPHQLILMGRTFTTNINE